MAGFELYTAVHHFPWDGDNLVAELGPTGATKVAEYSYYPGGLDNLHAINVGGSTNYYAHTDAIGNVRALTDGNGVVRRTYNYDEWGQLYGNSSDVLPFNGADRARWKGALWMGPELDLYYMRNRWYEPRTGRFLSEDPIGLSGGINQYAFGGGDPINTSDPLGLDAGGECDIYTWLYRIFQDGILRQVVYGWVHVSCDTSGPVPPTGRPRSGRGRSIGAAPASSPGRSPAPAAAPPAPRCPSGRPQGASLASPAPIGSSFGAVRELGSRVHPGVDRSVPIGTPVFARGSGRVSVVYTRTTGNMVRVDLGGGWVQREMHLSSVSVSARQQVTGGQQLGLSGNTGEAFNQRTGQWQSLEAHLHSQIDSAGVPVRPDAGCGP